jgi:glycosyltransferase involved in cell wall biosynthesis
MVLGNNPYPRDTRVRQQAEALRDAGHRVCVISPRAADQAARERVDGVQAVRYAAPPPARGTLGYVLEFGYLTLASTISVLLVWARDGLDVVHLHNPPDTLFVAALLPKLFGKKVVYDLHDLSPELYRAKYERTSPLLHRLLLLLERLSCLVADRVVTVNESYRAFVTGRGRVPDDRVTVVRNGPPLAQLEPVAPDPAWRGRAGTLIGYLGLIARQDGVDHLLRALHHLERDLGHHDWHAVVIGSAEDPAPLHDLAAELGVADRITWLGYQPPSVWRPVLAAADICSVPDPANALNEHSTMIKAMEYMALGKPLVAYDLREHRVSAGDAALYAAVDDPLDMARAFHRLAHDEALRERLGAVGRERIRDGLAWEYAAHELVGLYATAATW